MANTQANRERQRRYAQRHADRVRARKRAWSLANRERERARQKAWRNKNPDRVRAYYQNFKARHPEKVRANKERQYAKAVGRIAALKDHPCTDCGGRFPPECMDFDHRDSSTKRLTGVQLYSVDSEKVMAEIAKCDLVCANCHRIRTRRRRRAA